MNIREKTRLRLVPADQNGSPGQCDGCYYNKPNKVCDLRHATCMPWDGKTSWLKIFKEVKPNGD